MPKSYREKFEQDYQNWIRLMSRDAVHSLFALPGKEQNTVLKAYDDFKERLAIFRQIA